MGFCRRHLSHLLVRPAASDLFVRRVFCRRPIWSASGDRGNHAHFHAHFPKCRHDHRRFADHRCAVTAHQLQRFVRAHDYVRARSREQRLGSSARSRVKIDIVIALDLIRSRAI